MMSGDTLPSEVIATKIGKDQPLGKSLAKKRVIRISRLRENSFGKPAPPLSA